MSLATARELAVLATVRSHPSHGYALAETLSESIGWSLGMTRPTVYAVLKRFESRDWIEGRTLRDTQFPERVEYALTGEGEEAYLKLLRDVAGSEVDTVMPLAALLLHIDDLPSGERQQVLSRARDRRAERLQATESFADHEGTAGIGIRLMCAQLSQEIEHIDLALQAP